MKTMNVSFDDEEYLKLIERKGKNLSWHDFILLNCLSVKGRSDYLAKMLKERQDFVHGIQISELAKEINIPSDILHQYIAREEEEKENGK